MDLTGDNLEISMCVWSAVHKLFNDWSFVDKPSMYFRCGNWRPASSTAATSISKSQTNHLYTNWTWLPPFMLLCLLCNFVVFPLIRQITCQRPHLHKTRSNRKKNTAVPRQPETWTVDKKGRCVSTQSDGSRPVFEDDLRFKFKMP